MLQVVKLTIEKMRIRKPQDKLTTNTFSHRPPPFINCRRGSCVFHSEMSGCQYWHVDYDLNHVSRIETGKVQSVGCVPPSTSICGLLTCLLKFWPQPTPWPPASGHGLVNSDSEICSPMQNSIGCIHFVVVIASFSSSFL